MIGLRLYRPPTSARAALASIVGGVLIAAMGITGDDRLLVPIAMLPVALGVSLRLWGKRRFDARFGESALEIARPRKSVPYASFLEVRPLGILGRSNTRSFPIQVVHEAGTLLIPAALSAPSQKVYDALRDLVPPRSPRLPAALEQYRIEQVNSFGSERVWSCGPRRGPHGSPGTWTSAAAVALAFTGLAWIAIPVLSHSPPVWYLAGAMALVTGIALLAVDARHRRRAAKPPRPPAKDDPAMVIGPRGLAVQQGPLAGQAGWDEIRDVAIRRSGSFTLGAAAASPAIVLRVEGAEIRIADVYDRPLTEIHERIMAYWK